MAFMSTNGNSRFLFQTSNIGDVRLHGASKFDYQAMFPSLQFFSYTGTLIYNNIQRYFRTENESCESVHLRNYCVLSNLATSGMFKKDMHAPPIFKIHSWSNSLLEFRNKDSNALTSSSTKYVLTNEKSQHLFNQIRTFKTDVVPKIRSTNAKATGIWQKIKLFCGIGVTSLSSRDHLDNFLTKLNTDNISAEQSLRELKAYFEGHLAAVESLSVNRGFSWRTLLISFLAIGGVSYILVKTGVIDMHLDTVEPVDVTNSKVRFSDVKGADEAKHELQNVVEFLKNPEKFSSIGAKLPKGVLLVGPPGTGKTLLAKAVAGEAGVPFFSSAGSEFDEVFVGVGARRIRDLFKQAKDVAPCVIFIDEIDSIGKARTSSSLHPHANDTINQLLSEMDGFRNMNGIIVLGATNRKDDLDKALLRPGRFDVEVEVSLPDYVGRKELFEFYISKVRHQNIDSEKLARGTTGFTGADIENIVNQAALKAAMTGVPFVAMEHMDYARDKAIMGPESFTRIIDEDTNKITAYHESGHTVVAFFTKHSSPLHKVTIIARGPALGHTSYMPDKDSYHISKSEMLAQLDTMMGGRAAEEMVLGKDNVTSGASSDLAKATRLATNMVRLWGLSDSVGLPTYREKDSMSPETANVIDLEVKRLLHESYERAKSVLILHQKEHKDLSEALLKYETLNAEEITAIMNGQRLQKDA